MTTQQPTPLPHNAPALGRGLMRGHRPSFKLGYSWENAAITAAEMFNLSDADAAEVKAHLHGYALGLHQMGDDGPTDELIREYRATDPRLGTAFTEGHDAGWSEDPMLTYPASIETAAEQADRKRRENLMMKTCGCGATTERECAAAVEGYFTSLGQRSEMELRALYEGDGCEAARVVLVRRLEAE